ncbi:MAG TPA: hypothetical protein VMJ12_02150 [Candidatus Acidoferrales bacterium]|nr:hypothetical protein [Candidatus Acidoferrales bacterium]
MIITTQKPINKRVMAPIAYFDGAIGLSRPAVIPASRSCFPPARQGRLVGSLALPISTFINKHPDKNKRFIPTLVVLLVNRI